MPDTQSNQNPDSRLTRLLAEKSKQTSESVFLYKY